MAATSWTASISRPPLERASSVPERSSRSSYSSSKTSIDRPTSTDKGSRDALSCVRERSSVDSVRERVPHKEGNGPQTSSIHWETKRGIPDKLSSISQESIDRVGWKYPHYVANIEKPIELILMDENNVPMLDQAITPPLTPTKGFGNTMFNTGGFKGLAKRKLPSLKFKRGRMSSRSDKESGTSTPSSNPANPTITITMNDENDSISMVSDYLSPDQNFRGNRSPFPNIGDDVSLYGTPKEELSPLKECDSQKSSTAANYLKDQIISFFQPSDNKLAMKLFGNKNALMKEKMRQKAAGNWVIHPCSNFR